MKWFAVVVLFVASSCLAADAFKPSLDGKKLISYGMDWPNTAYVREHIGDMEKHPFDGCVIAVSKETKPTLQGESLGNMAWNRTAFDPKDYQHAIDDLKATKFSKFTDNFIQVEAMPADVDWFDDQQWAGVENNFRILAHVAKEGGCVGLEFDPEQYGSEYVWTPLAWGDAKLHGHSEAEFKAKAIARGQQLMKVINEQFPGIRILCLMGPALTFGDSKSPKHECLLLAPFLEGMCRAADDKTEITDGFEQSYGYRFEQSFIAARETMQKSRDTFEDGAAFDRVMRKGFGLWLDNDSGHRGWFPNDFAQNHFQPATWQNAVHFALKYSDRYVWVWREKIHEWENRDVGQAYEDAQRAARTSAARVEVIRQPSAVFGGKRQANGEDRDWGTTLGDQLKWARVLVDLSSPGWMFRPDPENRGVSENWASAPAKGPDWSPIEIGKFWEEQGWDYDGYGWYRRTISLDKTPAWKTQIVFGGCDESADVYLNGEHVGGHDEGEFGWDKPFSVDLTGKLKAGTNELAVRVLDRTGPGGIWKPAAIFAAHQFTTKGKKLIEYGWDCPDTAYVRAHVAEMEQRPFDGVIIEAHGSKKDARGRTRTLGDVFTKTRIDPADVDRCIEDLSATHFQKFTDNFIQMLSQPADVDFFDPDWDNVAANARDLARSAKAGHCVGFMLDPEQYGQNKVWTYAQYPEKLRAAHTLDEYRAKVRQRGEEFIRAINSELPNAKILCLFGPALTYGSARGGENGYSLLASFCEGMCAGGDAGTRVIDGFEQSYMYRTRTSFFEGRKDNELGRLTFANPRIFDRGMRVGFGLWMDFDSKKRPWNTTDFVQNYFQPTTWQDAINYGLSASDEYVWVYVERLNWWSGKDLPQAYVDAQRAGREKPDGTFTPYPSRVPEQFIKHAPATQPIASADVITNLTGADWVFRIDPNDVGIRDKWFAATDDAGAWSKIQIGKFWGEQGWDYDGLGWYRTQFKLSDPPLRNVAVHFEGIDESAEVWLNGQWLGKHDLGEYGWDKAFTLPATGNLRDGENELVVRVLNRSGPGGIWKPVTIVRTP